VDRPDTENGLSYERKPRRQMPGQHSELHFKDF